VVNGRNVQILGGITSHRWRHSNHSSSTFSFKDFIIIILIANCNCSFFNYLSAQYWVLSSASGMSPLNMFQRQVS
jgi:hypothetical protein